MKNEEIILSPSESILVGALVGMAQTILSLPFWTIKVRKQCNYPFTLNPLILYKGFTPAILSITLMSVSQVFASMYAHRLISNNLDKTDSDSTQRMLSGVTGGILSTVISNPAGVIITQRHENSKKNFTSITRDLTKKYGFKRLYISFLCNGVVNSIFTLGFYGLYPMLKNKFTYHTQEEFISTLASGASLGLLTGIVSQPFDTVKTLQEKNADKSKIPTPKYFHAIYKGKGISGFYSGFWPAVACTAAGITAAGVVIEKAQEYLSTNQCKP